jgi:NADH:ubiquinone oxidoreductase subunit 5 (subunit L)/multisubunit Na+/H+ antiporter MnhA subunit
LKSEKHKSVPAKGRDKIGTLLFMTGLAALVYGSSLIPSAVGWGLMSGAVILLLLFWRYESRDYISDA